jgi:UDP-N-acetylmuramate dehydrogenase
MALEILANAELSALNTFGVQARAARLLTIDAAEDIERALALVPAGDTPLVLGGGSNMLFTRDFDGTILCLRTRGRKILEQRAGSEAIVEVQAGESWTDLVRWTLEQRLYGLENLSLIPGCVGAAPIQNIGAYGVEIGEHFEALDAVDLESGDYRSFDHAACRFAYRDSVFKHAGGTRWLIVRVRLRLSRLARARFDYGDLRDELARASIAQPTPEDVARAVIALRTRKLPDPAQLGNAGSFFKNPVLEATQAALLREREPQIPHWPAAGGVKFSAAWMIERCGMKGLREGDAGVHAHHALVLVNHGRASGAQIWALAKRVREAVADRFGVRLEVEPRVL